MRLHYCVKHKREYYGAYGCVECEIAKAQRAARKAAWDKRKAKQEKGSTVNEYCDKHNHSKVLI